MLCRLCFAIIVLCLATPRAPRTLIRAHTYNTRQRSTRARRRCAHRTIEINSCLWPTHKAARYRVSREDRQLTCRTVLYVPPSSHLCRVYFGIHTLRDRDGVLCPFRGDYCALRCDSRHARNTEWRIYERVLFIIKLSRVHPVITELMHAQ